MDRVITVRCKKCGGQIEIALPREQMPGAAEMAESPPDTLVTSESMAPPPHGEEGTGEFQFLLVCEILLSPSSIQFTSSCPEL